jgi:hypothetical protein
MSVEIDQVRAWLLDEGDYEAASLISEAEFDFVCVDMAFRLDADEDFIVYELVIKVPPRIYRKIGKDFKAAADRIEAAYREIQQNLRGGYAKEITWGAKLPSLDEVEGTAATDEVFADSSLADTQRLWTKAKARLKDDPEGAVTAAKTMIESCCRSMIDSLGGTYTNNDDLPKLYKTLSGMLGIDASSNVEEDFKKLGGACSSIVNSISHIRNRTGDAHASSDDVNYLQACFVVNVAGSFVNYLVSLTKKCQQGGSANPL